MENVILVVLLIFAIFGFSEFLHILKLFIIFPKSKIDSQLVIKLKNATAIKQTVYTCEQFCWYGKRFADSLKFECSDLDDEIYESCRKIAQKYGIKIPKERK